MCVRRFRIFTTLHRFTDDCESIKSVVPGVTNIFWQVGYLQIQNPRIMRPRIIMSILWDRENELKFFSPIFLFVFFVTFPEVFSLCIVKLC